MFKNVYRLKGDTSVIGWLLCSSERTQFFILALNKQDLRYFDQILGVSAITAEL